MLLITLALRLALIAAIGFLVVANAVIAVFYLTFSPESGLTCVSPSRLAALATLIEQTAPDSRGQLIEAVSSPQFIVSVVGVGSLDAAGSSQEPASRRQNELREAYAVALAGRPVDVVAQEHSHNPLFARLSRLFTEAIEFRITLRGGDLLMVDAHTSFLVTPFGLPVGLSAGLFGTIVALLALLLMQRETVPLARLAAAVDRVDLSVDPLPLPEARRSAPEIRAVIASFNRLQGRLSEMLHGRMTLVGGIAHDVRTFATRLRLRVEHIPDAAERQRAIADIDDMSRLLDDALLSTRAGAGGLSQEMVEFAALVRADVEDRRAQGDAVDIEVENGAGEAVVLGDRLALRRVLSNIVDNALNYGGVAHVRAGIRGESIVVSIDDEGPGIPEDQRQVILEPFYRLEKSRNRSTGGAGLGLAVVRSLVEAHGGTIDISATLGGGARVNIALPIFQPA
jgi:signal transduction histidine kinase